MNIAALYATRELINAGVSTLPISIEVISKLIHEHGYMIISFNLLDDTSNKLLDEFNIPETIRNKPAFTYFSSHAKIVFCSHDLSVADKRAALTHELGHIVLNHVSALNILGFSDDPMTVSSQEIEADEFKTAFLAPICVLKQAGILSYTAIKDATCIKSDDASIVFEQINAVHQYEEIEKELCSHFKSYINNYKSSANHSKQKSLLKWFVIGILAITFITMLKYFYPAPNTRHIEIYTPVQTSAPTVIPVAPPTEQPTLNTPAPSDADYSNTQEVVVTMHGEKYHLPTCRYVKNKTNLFTLTITEAQNSGLEPCKVCMP